MEARKQKHSMIAPRNCLTNLARRLVSSYVERVRLLDHWQLHDDALIGEFTRGSFLLMVDKKALVRRDGENVRLVVNPYQEIKARLNDYGLPVEINNSCLIDVVDFRDDRDADEGLPEALFGTTVTTATPPEDSPVSHDGIRDELGKTLGGKFIDMRMAMLTMNDERDRNWLARMQALSRFSRVYRRCPKCSSALKMRISKSGAECVQCAKVYYPTYSPVSICLITDATNEHALLVRHRGSANGVFTCVAGFAMTGEPLDDTCKREIAEEVGIEATSIRSLGFSQPWPMPDSSLMIAYHAVADRSAAIQVSPDELEAARWFTRDEVAQALKRTDDDPFLRGISKDPETRQTLQYIPPRGAIAYQLIRKWVMKEL